MSLTRRLFARSVAASPIVARAALQDAAFKAAGGGVASVDAISSGPVPTGAAVSSVSILGRLMAASRAGLIDREDILRSIEADYTGTYLDADLAENRSFSLSTKFRLQRRRHAERRLWAEDNKMLGPWELAHKLGLFK